MEFTLEKRIVAGIHLGHPVRYWNPKITNYTYGVRNGIHLIDLIKTQRQLEIAKKFLSKIERDEKITLFIGTKNQAIQSIKERAQTSKSFFVTERWLGGTLTNWSTILTSLLKLHRLELEKKKNNWASLSKKDAILFQKRLERLERYFGGLKGIRTTPNTVIIVGQITELVAVRECRNLEIPIISRLDTDCDPNLTEIGVPINDDSRARIQLFLEILLPRIQNDRNQWIKKNK